VAGRVSVRDAWDEHAADWIRWARSEDHDHFYWRFSRPALLELLPAPGRLTLDLACGEGRLSRELRALGHSVLAVESSPALVRAARKEDKRLEVLRADVTRMPMGDGIADLAVCSMALMNFDDLDGALREIARVLAPGGRLCASLAHPARSAAKVPRYFEPRPFEERRERGRLRMTFVDIHRSFEAYARALEGAGFVIEALREPVPGADYVSDWPEVAPWREQPNLLVLRARRDA
jgi:SAM-dependent methyltransferase